MKYVYLNLQEQPRGNYMLDQLIGAGMVPVAVIEEQSTLAEKGRANLNRELEKLLPEVPLPRFLDEIIGDRQVRHEIVANHNNERCADLLAELAPDLILLGDTRIIQPHIIRIAPLGVINVHPGYLPLVRGNNPYIWALLHDLPQGCSVHYIDEEIDTGPVIMRRKMGLTSGMTYPSFLHEINLLCADLLIESLKRIAAGERGTPQSDYPEATAAWPTFRAATAEAKASAIEKLHQRTSRCEL